MRVNVAANRPGKEAEAEVVEIIERKEQSFIGTLQVDKTVTFLKTDSKFLGFDIFIPKTNSKGALTATKPW